MAAIGTFDEAMAAIHERSGYDRGFISNPFAGDDAARLGLRRTQAMLDRMGNPERSYEVVHVAGSKGKGSTCVLIDAILRASGRRSGRYLSPHLHSYLERFVVDDTPISREDFTALTAEGIATAEAIESQQPELGEITAFELTTAMALRWFKQAGCDVAVVEVGLGGTLDATNVVTPAVSVITRLDYEHTAILGDTMPEIASNKAGIIKPGRPAVTAMQPAEGLAVIHDRAREVGAPLMVAGADWTVRGTDQSFIATGPWGTIDNLELSLVGQHQVENAGLAIAAVTTLQATDPDAIRRGVRAASLPGRFERVPLPSGQTVVIDGAHTAASAAALATTLREQYPDAAIAIVVGMLRDKDPAVVLGPLLDVAAHWVVTAPDTPRALPEGDLHAALAALGATGDRAATVAEAIEAARRLDVTVVVVTGSLTTAAEARVELRLT